MRAEAGFSRHLNFRVFQQYSQTAVIADGAANGSNRPEAVGHED
jgi:hypothetical protein